MGVIAADIDQRKAAEYLLRLRRASASFQGFMAYLYPDMVWPGFMQEFQEVLNLLEQDALVSPGGNPIRSVLVNMPPRHAKSFNGTINFPAYFLARDPTRQAMISAYNDALAGTFGRATREIVTDPRVARAFSGFELSRETRAVDFWKTRAGGEYFAVGLNGTTTGRGANFLMVDDPYKSREEAESATMRRKVWDFYTAGLLSRLQPSRSGQPAFKIVTHTRWHPDDLAGRIMESPEFKRGEWVHLNFAALTVKERGVYIRRTELSPEDPRFVPAKVEAADGSQIDLINDAVKATQREVQETSETALWPERFPVEWLKAQRLAIGEREFAALYQQQPYVLGGNLIKENWFQRYKADEVPPFAALALSADTAFKAKASNDYSVFSLGGITESGDIYVLRVWREKMEFPELKRRIVALHAANRGRGLRGVWIEDAASGQALIQELKRDTGVPVMPWKPGANDKVARANFVTPLIEAGRVFIPEEADWLEPWMDEVVAFPNAKHDDQVDSLVILLDVLSRMVVTGQQNWAAPIADYLAQPGSVLSMPPINADPKGWAGGVSGFGQALLTQGQRVDAFAAETWRGWGE